MRHKQIRPHADSTLVYCDPPYVPASRTSDNDYAHEMTLADHERLLDLLIGLTVPVMLSGYATDLYADRRAAPLAIFSAIEAIAVPHDGTLSIHLSSGVARISVSHHHEEMAIVVPPILTRAGAQALALLILYSLHTPTSKDSAP